eukprot:932383-Pyramimonas_sp.AAC.1
MGASLVASIGIAWRCLLFGIAWHCLALLGNVTIEGTGGVETEEPGKAEEPPENGQRNNRKHRGRGTRGTEEPPRSGH